ncbi:PH domain-containing protein [Adlercreutzia aquisgranensis]|uniref:PH domain-containing protein n=1 Tax=Adlercreutzia aquisgranensis TaxID=2941323 RepID=UPI00203C095E|nr:PH domain-containing protein [Adlercreutzia aquisgranensis]
MSNPLANQLDPRVKAVWRITDAITLTLVFLGCVATFFLIAVFDEESSWAWGVCGAMAAIYAVLLVLLLAVIPPIRYARWRYQISPDYLQIERGIVWRKRFVIPFIRVQNTDTQQGPVLRMFGLSSVTVATAAGEHAIPGLDSEEAAQVRDKAAELARIAREDV